MTFAWYLTEEEAILALHECQEDEVCYPDSRLMFSTLIEVNVLYPDSSLMYSTLIVA